MTRRAYVPNPAAAEQLKRQGEYREGLGKISKNLAASIELASPVETGAFQDSIKTFDAGDHRGVMSDDPFAHLVEFGSVNNPPYAPFRRGVRAAGLRLEESPKQ